MELFESVLQCLSQLQGHLEGSKSKMPVACGITNQRETVVAFRKSTGEPLYNAISWMDVRTAPLVNELKSASDQICSKFETITGLKVSTFFSAFKIKWILENIPIVQQASEDQDLAICTLDSWILWKLTQGSSFYTDPSNASRTFLYSIVDNNYEWYPDLLKYFGVHVDWLPVIRSFGGIYGEIHEGLPFAGCKIAALIGDQQSSLIGHWGRSFEGKLKCTFGTGAFLLRSIESKGSALDNPGALKTVLFNENYIEEFPIVCAGSLVKWMQNSLGFIGSASELNQIDFYPRNPPNDSVYFIPNLSGCLFPAWDPSLRGSFHNLSLQSDKMEMILAVLESVAFCIRRALDNLHVSVLSVDGGMCTNRHFCQLLANICNCEISKTRHILDVINLLFFRNSR